MKFLRILFVLLLFIFSAIGPISHAQELNAGKSLSTAVPPPKLQNESEVGIVVTSGNARTQSYNLKQTNSYLFSGNLLRFIGKYLQTRNQGIESARQWSLGLRYEREISTRWALFAGQSLDSDIFAGYFQRYNSDGGGKYFILKQERLEWLTEAGYRFTHENRRNGQSKQFHYARIYSEFTRGWNENVSSKLSVEYLPNLVESRDWLLNGEFSTSAVLNKIFSLKVSYAVRYRNVPPPTAIAKTDTVFTTALVATY